MISIFKETVTYMFWTSCLTKKNICVVLADCRPYCSVTAKMADDEQQTFQLCNYQASSQMSILLGKTCNLISHHSKQNMRLKYHATRDEVCDEKVKELIASNNVKGALATMIRYTNVDRYPSKRTLVILAAMSASERNTEAISKLQAICKNIYPKEYIYQMEYKHYLAEALWRDANNKKAITLFHQILLQYPKRTKKISDMITFLTRHLVENRLVEDLQLLLKTVKNCVGHGIHQPLANVWQQLFVSEIVGQQLMSDDIIKTCDPTTKKFILKKVDSIVQNVNKYHTSDLLRRLIEVILYFEHQPYYSRVFSALLDHQCNTDDVNGALATFYHMVEEKIIVERQACYKLMLLLSQHHRKAPEALLKMKYNIPSTQTLIYSF